MNINVTYAQYTTHSYNLIIASKKWALVTIKVVNDNYTISSRHGSIDLENAYAVSTGMKERAE